MNTKLLKFHQNCKEEYDALLKSFNLLFYGYGNKEVLLSQLFTDAFIFNMRFCTIDSILEEVSEEILNKKQAKTLHDLDSYLMSKNKRITFILLNFNFSLKEFENLKAIELIATIETVDFDFTQDDLLKFNFLLRDMTTFEDYTDDIVSSEIMNNRIQNVKLIFGNLSKKPKFAFLELLKLGNCTFNTLFDTIKNQLFLSKVQSLNDHLREFIDHKIIKVKGDSIVINLTDFEKKSLLEILNEKESNSLLKN